MRRLRPPAQLSRWVSRTPVTIPRFVLTVKYLAFVVLAVLTAVKGSTTLNLANLESYTPVWSLGVALAALVALPFSLHERFEQREKWCAVLLSGFLSVIALHSFLLTRGSSWFYVVLVMMLPAGRALYLFSRKDRAA